MKEILSPHLQLAKNYWKAHLKPGDSAIDATCGNGHDTLFLCQLLAEGYVAAYDIQSTAVEKTRKRLEEHLTSEQLKRVALHNRSHAELDAPLPHLIVYNLGYLPGGDKTIVTKTETTLESLEKAYRLLAPGGALSITCYPGHDEGLREEEAVLEWAANLNASVCYHKWINRPRSPTLLWIVKEERK